MSDQERFANALTAAARSFKATASDRLRHSGVHPGQNFLLEALRDHTAMTTSEIARQLHIEVPTATRMAQRMEAAGLVTRRRDPEDRRRVRISLTSSGRDAAETVPSIIAQVARQALEGISRADRVRLITCLERAADNLGWPSEDTEPPGDTPRIN